MVEAKKCCVAEGLGASVVLCVVGLGVVVGESEGGEAEVRGLLVGESVGSVLFSVLSGVVVSVLSAVGGLGAGVVGFSCADGCLLVVGSVQVPVLPVVSRLVGV